MPFVSLVLFVYQPLSLAVQAAGISQHEPADAHISEVVSPFCAQSSLRFERSSECHCV